MNDALLWILALAGAAALSALAYFVGLRHAQKLMASQIQADTERARLEVREKELQAREAVEEERLALEEERRQLKDDLNDRKERVAEHEQRLFDKEKALLVEQEALKAKEQQLAKANEEANEKLQEISELTKKQAREQFLENVEREFREEAALRLKEMEKQAMADARKKARHVLLETMERTATEYVNEATSSLVPLSGEDMKGRLIGREGRNIRSFEQTTGVDLIVDETPEAVVVSCFDPVRREIARLTLMNLMLDGRIHPGRIEELYKKAREEVKQVAREAAEDAVLRAEVGSLPDEVIDVLGDLRFRTSYGQNMLDHSVEVAQISGIIAAEVGANVRVARRASLLHDIGKVLGSEWHGPHALAGMEFLKQKGEPQSVLNAVGAHHYEIEPESAEAHLVIIADTLSASRPGARRDSLENYLRRLQDLEHLALEFKGVEQAYAIQAGRELRVLVRPSEISDEEAKRLSARLVRRIQQEKEIPGQITVTVVRETRAVGKTE
ncbi:MAG: ribonuclease Y [Fimbriimonadaceae bacterium]